MVVNWPAFAGGSSTNTAQGYELDASTSSNFVTYTSSITSAVAQSTLTISGLTPFTTYYLRAGAINWDNVVNMVVIGSTSTASAQAATYYWIAPGNSNWNNINNWSATSGGAALGTTPNAAAAVIFDGNGVGNCLIDTTISISMLTISTAAAGSYPGSVDTSSNSMTMSSFTMTSGNFYARTSTMTVFGSCVLKQRNV